MEEKFRAAGAAGCERCQRAEWTAAVCHTEIDAIELQRTREALLLASLLEATAPWGDFSADGADGTAAAPLSMLRDRVLAMHRMLLRHADERRLLEPALDLLSSRLGRMEQEVENVRCAMCGPRPAGEGPVHVQAEARILAVCETTRGIGGEGAGGGKGGSLATVWRTLRAKEEECAVLTQLLRKMGAAWHREALERASELEQERLQVAYLYICIDVCIYVCTYMYIA
jgi:hypothetical protein